MTERRPIRLYGEPLEIAVCRCQIGGLLPDHWMPLGFAAKDAVIARHGGDSHFVMQNGSTILFRNAKPGDEPYRSVA
jgi:hypothetical protein